MVYIGKRGQAAGAAVLLALIAALLVMFVILLPPQERADLLGEGSPGSGTGTVSERLLLQESPGRIDFIAQDEIEHPLPVVNVYTRTQTKSLAERNLATPKHGIFTDDQVSFEFRIPDVQNTENVLLSFRVASSDGRVMVILNGEEVFNEEVFEGAVQPIPLTKSLLNEMNTVSFSVSSPGGAFWKTNEARLEDIKVIADVTSIESQTARSVFLISDTEKGNLEKVQLKFQPECRIGDVGKLRVVINGNELYNAIPDCGVPIIPIEFSSDLIYTGENEIVFQTMKGTYVLSHIRLVSQLKEVDFPTYYFELSNEEYQDVKDGNRNVKLILDFVDVVTAKRGELVVNGNRRHFDTTEASFDLDMSDDVVRGSNSIKIKPSKTIEVRELRAEFVE
ncbi:MAG: hypothetical protein Q8Q01_02240 [archaeon]|nr:hypothetical protein [archaeon]